MSTRCGGIGTVSNPTLQIMRLKDRLNILLRSDNCGAKILKLGSYVYSKLSWCEQAHSPHRPSIKAVQCYGLWETNW